MLCEAFSIWKLYTNDIYLFWLSGIVPGKNATRYIYEVCNWIIYFLICVMFTIANKAVRGFTETVCWRHAIIFFTYIWILCSSTKVIGGFSLIYFNISRNIISRNILLWKNTTIRELLKNFPNKIRKKMFSKKIFLKEHSQKKNSSKKMFPKYSSNEIFLCPQNLLHGKHSS